MPDPGHRLFAQYAHAPNALGYCGPPGCEALEDVACGQGEGVDVPRLAKQFSGAWPYQQIIAELSGLADPLDPAVVRAYWTGNDLTAALDPRAFGSALLKRIAPLTGQYWSHLTPDLLDEAAPTHAFHVLSVYPWSRLLGTGHPEPLQVLDSCRIGWGTVEELTDHGLVISSSHLEQRGPHLVLGEPRQELVPFVRAGRSFVADVAPGDVVAVHWGFVCDRLTPAEAAALESGTRWQLEAVGPRLEAAAR